MENENKLGGVTTGGQADSRSELRRLNEIVDGGFDKRLIGQLGWELNPKVIWGNTLVKISIYFY